MISGLRFGKHYVCFTHKNSETVMNTAYCAFLENNNPCAYTPICSMGTLLFRASRYPLRFRLHFVLLTIFVGKIIIVNL